MWVTTRAIKFQDGKLKKGSRVTRIWKAKRKGCYLVTVANEGSHLKIEVPFSALMWDKAQTYGGIGEPAPIPPEPDKSPEQEHFELKLAKWKAKHAQQKKGDDATVDATGSGDAAIQKVVADMEAQIILNKLNYMKTVLGSAVKQPTPIKLPPSTAEATLNTPSVSQNPYAYSDYHHKLMPQTYYGEFTNETL